MPRVVPELVLLETLRLHLASAPAIDAGWLAALADPIVAPARARLHAAPERRAEDLLATTHHSVGTVARRVGYDSEEAFSRAFKRIHAQPPAAWRHERQRRALDTR